MRTCRGARAMAIEPPQIGAGDAAELLVRRLGCERRVAWRWLTNWFESGDIEGRPCGRAAVERDFRLDRGLWKPTDDTRAFQSLVGDALAGVKVDDLNRQWEFDRMEVAAACDRLVQQTIIDGASSREVGSPS